MRCVQCRTRREQHVLLHDIHDRKTKDFPIWGSNIHFHVLKLDQPDRIQSIKPSSILVLHELHFSPHIAPLTSLVSGFFGLIIFLPLIREFAFNERMKVSEHRNLKCTNLFRELFICCCHGMKDSRGFI